MSDPQIDVQQHLFQLIARTVINLRKVGADKIDRPLVQARITQLEKNWEKFDDGHQKLMLRLSEEKVRDSAYITSDVYTTCEEQYYSNKAELHKLHDSLQAEQTSRRNSLSEASASSAGRRATRSLPRINLPRFSGKYTEWTSFHDLFMSLVGDDEDLRPVEKFQHLKTCLIGDAAKLIENIPITGDNYEQALHLLKSRYQNKRALVNAQLEILFGLRSLSSKNAVDLERLRSTVSGVLEALRALGGPVDKWDMFLVFHISRRLDPDTHEAWELHLGAGTDPPTYAEFNTFLEGRVRALENVSVRPTSHARYSPKHSQKATSSSHAALATPMASSTPVKSSTGFFCSFCSGQHYISTCNDYLQMSPEQRRDFATSKNLCLNCLGKHRTKDCRSPRRCNKCRQRHHGTLHDVFAAQQQGASVNTTVSGSSGNSSAPVATNSNSSRPQQGTADLQTPQSAATHHAFPVSPVSGPVLLPTAVVRAISAEGAEVCARALIDQGSELTFVKESLVQGLHLPRHHSSITIFGIGTQKCATTRGAVSLKLKSRFDPASEFTVEAHVVPRLTHHLPGRPVRIDVWPHLSGLDLADPSCGSPGPVDILLGANVYGQLLEEEMRKGESTAPIAQRTTIGWIISGPTAEPSDAVVAAQGMFCCPDRKLDLMVSEFWSQETIPSSVRAQLSKDDAACEEYFVKSHSRDGEGRYVVRLPFKNRPVDFGDTKNIAHSMLQNLQRRFERAPALRSMYTEFLTEYEQLGHMERVESSEDKGCFYLPHHGVLRESSVTTKLRVVFNGSQQTCLGYSLNDCLLSGPKLQNDLTDVLLRWRMHQFVFSADAEKMYRQIRVHPEDRPFQRILWSPDKREEPKTFELSTVTYGMSCAPYLALRTLRQLAKDEGSKYPLAIDVIKRDMYVDDALSGADSLELVREKIRQVDGIFMAGGFRMQKWTSNCKTILSGVIEDARQQHVPISFEEGPLPRALGVAWDPISDDFIVMSHKEVIAEKRVTKRLVLSLTASLFDPLGWLAPVLIVAKVFLQSLWKLDIQWDDPVPQHLAKRWQKFTDELKSAEPVRIPRWIGAGSAAYLEVHGFSDASQDALSAVVYLRVVFDDFHARTSLLTAKTKVAPLKRTIIARLELSAAVLLSNLVSRVCSALDFKDIPIHLWTDSAVSLAWIRNHPSRWKDYVGNRVALIQDVVPRAQWRHVPGIDNPADAASRGLTPEELRQCRTWWFGPEWLSLPSASWNLSDPQLPADVDLEERPVNVHNVTSQPPMWSLISRYSSLTKIVRVTAWIFRAVSGFKRRTARSSSTLLLPAELDQALYFWIKETQKTHFSHEISLLAEGKALPRSNHLIRLLPFVDGGGTLRLGGRLGNSLLGTDAKYPIILPRKSVLTSLIIADAHRKTLHGGTQLTLSTLRLKYWIVGGRAPVRSHILKCVTCTRYRGENAKQLMGQLPSPRLTPSRPFLNCGVDYAGPFILRAWHGRKSKTYKSYLIVFVCFSTSAVHLELSSDYTTDGFLAAYRRFSGRRGLCATITSDCGSNLVGADAELKRLFSASSKDFAKLRDVLASDRTEWKFNPPAAPHFGGKWESAVRSSKFHIKRIVGDAVLTFEEFYTLLVQVEGILNSRPLVPLTDDPDDVSALTPGHFLTGGPITAPPEPSLAGLPSSRLSKWQRARKMVEHFWQRWQREYLQKLLSISKWHSRSDNISVGSLTLIIDERYPPSKWPLARVVETHPGRDGLVRVVSVKTASGTVFKRPIVKLCPLPVDRDTDI